MPHRPTQQLHLNLASPEPEPLPYPSSILGGGSTPTKHPKPIATKFSPQNPDLIQPSNKPSSSFMLKHFSTLNIITHKPRPPHNHKPSSQTKNHHHHHPPHPPPPPVDTHLQGNAMAIAPKLIAKRPSKEKPLKLKKEVERRKLDDDDEEEGVMKKKGFQYHHSKVLFEDAAVNNKVKKNSRVIIPPVVDEEEHDDDVVVKRHSVSLSHHPSNGGGGGNRRRSFCGSQVVVDLCDVFAVNGVKVVSADMPPFMQIHAVDCARKAFDSMEKFKSKTLALTLKKEFDGVYGPAWHCIVGTNFGSFVTHSVGGFLYFSMDQKYYILLFKTAVQKAG